MNLSVGQKTMGVSDFLNYKVPLSGIYKITTPKGRIYIGKASCFYNRLNSYQSMNCKNQIRIYRSLKKYGVENHTFEILEICLKEHLNYYEIYYIWLFETYRTKHGMNLTTGGDGLSGFKHSEETKKKIGNSNRGNKLPPQSDETRRKRSASMMGKNKGIKRSAETNEKNRLGHIGIRHSEESKNKLSNTMKGRLKSDDTKRKLSVANTGKKRTQETKARISVAKKGKKMTDTTKENMSNIILNLQTGIFYIGLEKASEQINMRPVSLGRRLNGDVKNNTPFIYV